PARPGGLIRYAMAAVGTSDSNPGGSGADDPGEPRKDVWAYDTETATWSQKPAMPVARAGHGSVSVGGKLYVIGGTGTDPGRVLVFNPADGEWRTTAALPTVRRALAVATDGKTIYAVGGIRPDGSVSGALEALDTASGKWTALPALPGARGALVAGVLEGQLHVVGGATWKPLKTYASHDVFNLASKSWSKKAALSSARQGMAAGVAAGRLWVIGGGSGAGVFGVFTASDAVESFEP
ncbi:MAG: Kelch repeat-containing protein, partial [Alphaproteobacteria bacterium]